MKGLCCLSPEKERHLNDLGLLLLRVAFGGLMLAGHGWGKLMTFGEKAATFPDPLGVGSTISLSLCIGAEVFCSLLVILGLLTRLAVLPLMFTMGVAILIIHADDPWRNKEFALLFFIPYLVLLFTGAGNYSLDARCKRRCQSSS